jgi:ABC-type proline/glycine betaine transport system substrate-binding protein
VIETKGADADGFGQKFLLMVGRYPLEAAKNWLEANEKEIDEWDGEKLDRKMILTYV